MAGVTKAASFRMPASWPMHTQVFLHLSLPAKLLILLQLELRVGLRKALTRGLGVTQGLNH